MLGGSKPVTPGMSEPTEEPAADDRAEIPMTTSPTMPPGRLARHDPASDKPHDQSEEYPSKKPQGPSSSRPGTLRFAARSALSARFVNRERTPDGGGLTDDEAFILIACSSPSPATSAVLGPQHTAAGKSPRRVPAAYRFPRHGHRQRGGRDQRRARRRGGITEQPDLRTDRRSAGEARHRAGRRRARAYNVNYNPPPKAIPPTSNGERYGYTVSRGFSVKVRSIGKAGRGKRCLHRLGRDCDQRRRASARRS